MYSFFMQVPPLLNIQLFFSKLFRYGAKLIVFFFDSYFSTVDLVSYVFLNLVFVWLYVLPWNLLALSVDGLWTFVFVIGQGLDDLWDHRIYIHHCVNTTQKSLWTLSRNSKTSKKEVKMRKFWLWLNMLLPKNCFRF